MLAPVALSSGPLPFGPTQLVSPMVAHGVVSVFFMFLCSCFCI